MDIYLNGVSLDDLLDKMDERMEKRLKSIVSTPQELPEFLTKTQAQKYLGNISQPTFDKLVEKEVIAAYKVSEGRVVFYLPQLREYVLAKKVPA